MTEEARGWEHGPTVAFFFETGISRIFDFRLKNWRIAELEMTEEPRGWEHGPTTAFFF